MPTNFKSHVFKEHEQRHPCRGINQVGLSTNLKLTPTLLQPTTKNMKTIVEKLLPSTRGPLRLRTKPRSSHTAIIIQTYAIIG